MSRYPQALSFKGLGFVQIIILQEEGLKKENDKSFHPLWISSPCLKEDEALTEGLLKLSEENAEITEGYLAAMSVQSDTEKHRHQQNVVSCP